MHRIRYLIGALTLLAAVVGAIEVVRMLQNLDERPGMPLQIEFRDARGLRAGADVRYRGVTVGTVRSVSVTSDGGKAVASVLLEPPGAAQVCVDSSFWIVTPRFGGLTGGASGLDTLVRDAYLTFQTPAERGSPLAAGSHVTGRERPPAAVEPETLDDVEHGDLMMTLLVPENHGLRPGSAVVFRGTPTGDVRSVDLAKDGTHVEVQLRIARRHRLTVTDRSAFWIARPSLTGALFSGFAVTELNALLSPFVSYYGQPGQGVPVLDGHRAAAEAMRPDVEVTGVPPDALRRPSAAAPAHADDLVLVRVVYAALEHDSLSADDPVHCEGTGVLFVDRGGRTVVATARSLVDGSWTESDLFGGSPEIVDEQIKVMLPSGKVVRAGRVWVHAGGADLAVIVLDDVPPDLVGTPADRLDFRGAGTDLSLRAVGPDGAILPPGPVPTANVCPEGLGGAVCADGRIVGILGRATGDAPTSITWIEQLPADLRPR